MSMTDTIADFLARIRNSISAGKSKVECPNSKLKERIAAILKEEGYIDAIERREGNVQGVLELTIRYSDRYTAAISGLRRVSRPGQRRYVRAKDIPRVRNGLGIAIVSTSRGLMTDREARKLGLGGELICEVW
jgi:small subunit ribosomal protein S8